MFVVILFVRQFQFYGAGYTFGRFRFLFLFFHIFFFQCYPSIWKERKTHTLFTEGYYNPLRHFEICFEVERAY